MSKDAVLAILYELRLRLKNDCRENYTIEELFDLLDEFAEEC